MSAWVAEFTGLMTALPRMRWPQYDCMPGSEAYCLETISMSWRPESVGRDEPEPMITGSPFLSTSSETVW